jgi:branched-chain amino acid transport system permease protein
MELCILGGVLDTLVIAAMFGFVCVRYTRIFFGILTLALMWFSNTPTASW